MDKKDHIQKLSTHPPQGSSHLGCFSTTSKLLIRIFHSLSTFSSTTYCQPPCNQAPDPISPSLSLPFGSIGHIKPLSTFLPCFWDRTRSWSSSCFRHASVLALLAVSPSHPPHFLAWPALPTKEVTLLTPTSKGTWHPAPIPLSNLIFLPLL